MDDSTPQRKSGRRPVPNKKYAKENIEILNKVLASDSEDDVALSQHLQEDSNSDDAFPEDQVIAEADDDEDDSLVDDISDGSGIKTPVEVYEDAHSYASSEPAEVMTPGRNITKRKDKRVHRDPNVHSRGMPEVPIKTDNHRSRVNIFAGEDMEGILHIAKSRDQWATDPTLPHRNRLCHLFSHTEEKRQMEATVGWDWYYNEGGREEFARRQESTEMTETGTIEYISKPKSGYQTVLMGPYRGQQAVDIAHLGSVSLGSGYILNLGNRITCLDWAPNHGEMQYLALSTSRIGLSDKQNTAFSTSVGPASIQLWELAAHAQTSSPQLRMILCSRWGGIKQLKWCPVPRMIRDQKSDGVSIGLLAGIWSDGFARVG